MARPERPMTADRVRAGVLRHVQRFAAPRAHVRRLYLRKIDQSLKLVPGDREALLAALEEALQCAERYGFIDDAHLAEVRVARGLARGVSPRQLQARLGGKGLSAEVIDAGLAAAPGGNAEAAACEAYVKRRRLGPWRAPEERAAHREKDLARLGRAGFGYVIAKAALDRSEGED